MNNHEKTLEQTKIQLMTIPDAAFFTALCFSLQHIWDENIPTAATDGRSIRYNPEFFESLTKTERLFLLLHETLHVAFQHMTRKGDRNDYIWNMAADYVINYILVNRNFSMPAGGLYDSKYADWSTAEVYDDLNQQTMENLKPVPWEDVEEPSDGEETQEKIDDMLMKAQVQSEMADDSAGTVPGNLQWYINQLRNPTLPWYSLLSRLVNKTVKRGFTWKKPNRRFFPEQFLPARNSKRLCDLAVAIDVSGSVRSDEFHFFCSEIYDILVNQKPSSLKLIQFDTEIRSITNIRSVRDLTRVEFNGGGGTDIRPIIHWAQENRPNALITFTDGHFDSYHSNPGVPLFWIIHNNPYWKAPYGKVIHHHF